MPDATGFLYRNTVLGPLCKTRENAIIYGTDFRRPEDSVDEDSHEMI